MNLAGSCSIAAGALLSTAGGSTVHGSASGAVGTGWPAAIARTWQQGHFSGDSGAAGTPSSSGEARWQLGHAAGAAASACAAAAGLGQHHPIGSAIAKAFEIARILNSVPMSRLYAVARPRVQNRRKSLQCKGDSRFTTPLRRCPTPLPSSPSAG